MPLGNLINNVSQIRYLEQLRRGEFEMADGWAGEDSVARTMNEVLAEYPRSILDFAGADAEAKLVSALASGEQRLFVPAGTVVVFSSAVVVPSGTHLSGQPGAILNAATTNNLNILEVTGSDVVIEDLTFICTNDVTGIFSNDKPGGAAVAINGGTRVKLRRLDVSGHRSWGVYFRNATDGVVEDCYIHDGSLPATPNHGNNGADIAVLAGATRITVRRNHCIGGLHTGIYCQTSTSATPVIQDRVRVLDNIVSGQGGYGIMGYNNAIGVDDITRMVIVGNDVSGITGAIPFNDGGGDIFQYGPGIYALNCNSVAILDNEVDDCLGSNVNETLGAAAILINDAVSSIVAGNKVSNSEKRGISVRNSNRDVLVTNSAIIANNICSGCGSYGIRLVMLQNFTASGNVCSDNVSGMQIVGDPTIFTQFGQVIGNTFADNTSDGFVSSTSTNRYINIIGNVSANNGRFGFNFDRISDSIVTDNQAIDNTSQQFKADAASTFRSFRNNIGNGASDFILDGNIPEGVYLNPVTTGSVTLGQTTPRKIIFTSALTGNVTFSGPTISSNNAPLGLEIEIVRAASSTGAFTCTFSGVSVSAGEGMRHVVTASGTWTCLGKWSGVP